MKKILFCFLVFLSFLCVSCSIEQNQNEPEIVSSSQNSSSVDDNDYYYSSITTLKKYISNNGTISVNTYNGKEYAIYKLDVYSDNSNGYIRKMFWQYDTNLDCVSFYYGKGDNTTYYITKMYIVFFTMLKKPSTFVGNISKNYLDSDTNPPITFEVHYDFPSPIVYENSNADTTYVNDCQNDCNSQIEYYMSMINYSLSKMNLNLGLFGFNNYKES